VLLVFPARLVKAQDYLSQPGRPAFSILQPVPFGVVNVANGNVHVEIPLASAPQRGDLKFSAKMVYDSRIWQIVKTGGSQVWKPTNIPNSYGGWRFATTADVGTVTSDSDTMQSPCSSNSATINFNFVWTSPDGTRRYFPVGTVQDAGCSDDQPKADGFAVDASGYHIFVSNYTNAVVYAKDGTQVFPTLEDTNGNYFSADANGNVIDTLGRTVVTKSSSGNQIYYDILNSQGTTSRITVTTRTIQLCTEFMIQMPGVTDDRNDSLTVVDSISLPSKDKYYFAYDEPVIQSGGGCTVDHGYGLLRGVGVNGLAPDGMYTYENFVDAFGVVNRWATRTFDASIAYSAFPGEIVAKLSRNQGTETLTFTLNNGAWLTGAFTSVGTQVINNYDFTQQCPPPPFSNVIITACNGPAYILLTGSTVSDGGGTKKTTYGYDDVRFGNLTAINSWNYYQGTAPTNPDRQTAIIMHPLIGNNILNRVASSTLMDSAGHQVSQTTYSYDGAGLATPPQQPVKNNDTNVGTGRGNLTQINQWVGGTTFLTTNLQYDTTGQIVSVQDPAGNKTTVDYTDTFFNPHYS
jgi:hypothetical protein